jgi:hypothetical protein
MFLRSAMALLITSLVSVPAVANQRAHTHGVAMLSVAIDGADLTVFLESPLDSLVGFEHRPRTAGQRQAADTALARIRDVAAWLSLPAVAGCTVTTMTVDDAAFQPAPANSSPPGQQGEHADLTAQVSFRCQAPEQLQSLDIGLFTAFPRMRRIEAEVAGPGGQRKQTLRATAATLRLQR